MTTIYTPAQLGEFWLWAGGPASAQRTAVAVAMAESGGDADAVGGGGYGFWQIQLADWIGRTGGCGISYSNWSQPGVNACAAVYISQKGANWAPWCTMWADPNRDCGHGYITVPQPGSAAYPFWAGQASGAAGTPALPPAVPTAGAASAAAGWACFQQFFRHDVPYYWSAFNGIRARAVNGMGWIR